MLRTTVSKLRHVCALAYFVPRLLRGNIRNIPGRFEKLSVSVQRRVDKSTDSSPKDDSDYERCQRIIDRAFSPNPPHTHFIPDTNAKHKPSFMNLVAPEMPTNPENQCEKCQRIIDKIFGEDSNAGDKKRDIVDPVCIPLTELQATTAKENVETLAQKVEVIDETPLVEAAAKSKIEGFNVHPKVLGNRKKRRTIDKIPILNYSTDKPIHGRRKGSSRKDNSLDELAKRCLDTPSGQIDERLLKEMKKLGVPPSTRRGSRRTASDAGIVQPDIMRRPRRPVEKTDLDFLSRMKRMRELERLNDDLPPPFELIPVKANSVNLSSSCEAEDNSLYVERIQPYHLTDQIRSQPESANNEEEFIGSNAYNDERPPQQLLGHMTAAVMSDESNTMTDKSNEIEHLIIRQERLNFNDNITVGPSDDFRHRKPGLRNNTGEEISLLKLKQIEKENAAISTNLLSDLVDPNDISPQTEPSSFIKEYKEIETLRNLLQTRFEHLTNNNVKSRQFKESITEFSKDSSPLTNFETNDQQGVETLRMERLKPVHLKEDQNIIFKETSPHSEPGILIRETTKNEPMKDTAGKSQFFRGYSPNQELLTPHQLFEQISLISRETELGTVDDYTETDYSSPGKATPSQLLDKVGVICKANPPSMQNKLLPENNTQNIVTKQSDPNQVYLDPYDKNVPDNGPEDYVYTNLKEEQDSGVELLHHTLLSSSELSRRPLTEEETDDPVIAVEMGRIDSAAAQEHLTDHNVLVSTLNRELNQDQLPNRNVLVSALNREPIFQETGESKTIAPETILNPLLDKGTITHVAADNLNANNDMSDSIPKEHPQQPLTLSEMLKRVRERNRIELCKGFVELKIQNTQVDPVVGECGKKNPPCPPPAPTCPPPPKPPCPPEKPPCPNPCKPKCPPTCPPAPCGEPKPKCPPPKKSPCDKFKKTKCSCVTIQDVLTLLLHFGPQLHIPQKSMLPLVACALNLNTSIQDSKTEAMERIIIKLQDLCGIVLIASFRGDVDALETIVAESEGINYAKTYDPWSPIPSWPVPVKEEKRKLVCPKEGCKVIPPKLNAPCRDINPCAHLPRHNKYSIIDFIIRKLGKKVVCDV